MSTLVFNHEEIAPRELKPTLFELHGISRESVTAHFKLYQGYVNKRNEILRKLAERLLPPEVVTARKSGFAPPVRAWLRGPLRPLVERALKLLHQPGILGRRQQSVEEPRHQVEVTKRVGRADHQQRGQQRVAEQRLLDGLQVFFAQKQLAEHINCR